MRFPALLELADWRPVPALKPLRRRLPSRFVPGQIAAALAVALERGQLPPPDCRRAEVGEAARRSSRWHRGHTAADRRAEPTVGPNLGRASNLDCGRPNSQSLASSSSPIVV